MLPPKFQDVVTLLRTYLGKRPRRGPFPLESAFTWSTLLSCQSASGLRGDMLEIGVEFGTSGFLMLESLAPDEQATFIDIAATQEWRAGMAGPYSDKTNVQFMTGNSLHMNVADMPSQCRWIHIDGGHLYQHVANDLALTADSLAEGGVIVLDDFFEIRWPDVTAAILQFLKEDSRLTPFLLVNRKLYCTGHPEQALAYQAMFADFLESNRSLIGDPRWWLEVEMLGQQVMVAKLALGQELSGLETDQQV
jgi:hypothetical protein